MIRKHQEPNKPKESKLVFGVPPFLLVATHAVLLGFCVKALQPVVTMFAKVPLRHFSPFHLKAVACGGKGLEVAGRTLHTTGLGVVVMTEKDVPRVFDLKSDVSRT